MFCKTLALVFMILALFSSCAVPQSAKSVALKQIGESPGTGKLSKSPQNLRELNLILDGKWIGKAVSYGCYREGQAPGEKGPSKAEVLEDLKIMLEHWNLIRVYNADDDTRRILEVIQEHNIPIKMLLGIWLEKEEDSASAKASNQKNVLRGIELANAYPEIIRAISVGNETQVFWSWHRMDREALIAYIREVRGKRKYRLQLRMTTISGTSRKAKPWRMNWILL